MKSVKIFGKSVPLLAIVMVSMLVIGASAYAFVGVASASSTLTLRYYTGINGGGDPVTGLSVYVKTSGGADVTSKGGVSGTTSFSLEDGNYNVVSVKGASSRIDPVVVSGATTVDIQCGKLIVNYNTNNDGTDISHGSGTDVTGVSVYVKWAANMGDVASAGGVSGSTSFALLAGDSAYKVVSVKGASSRTDGPYTVASDNAFNIQCGKLIVNYNTNNDGTDISHGSGTDVTGVSVYVKWAANMGDVASAGGVSGSTSFALLAGDSAYKVVSVKGASSRTDGPYTVASDNAFNIQCGKLIVTYYANNNALWGMTGVSVYVKWAANMGDVASAGGVSGSTSFALLAGDSAYKVVSVKGASSRTDGPYTVASTQTADIPVARFRVVVVKSDFTAQTGVSVYVKTSGGGDVASAGGVSGSVDFSLLQSKDGPGPYRFIAIKGSTAQADQSANEVPPAGLSGVILMIP